jgi:hypothetical protein
VHRNVGNMIPGNDLNALSVLEFAVSNLDVTDIIVTGTLQDLIVSLLVCIHYCPFLWSFAIDDCSQLPPWLLTYCRSLRLRGGACGHEEAGPWSAGELAATDP